jgi:hypothetical protein
MIALDRFFSENMIVGIVYGGDGAGNMYFNPLYTLGFNLTGVKLWCNC